MDRFPKGFMSFSTANTVVHETKASYYNTTTKKWIPGRISIKGWAVEYVSSPDQKKNDQAPINLVINYNDVSAIKQENASFVFGAITVLEKGKKHWFSSFSNRDAFFNMLVLFWRERLFGHSKLRNSISLDAISVPRDRLSSISQELLEIACDAEDTLTIAATTLEAQSKQLSYAEDTVEEINSELTAIERILQYLSSWIPRVPKPPPIKLPINHKKPRAKQFSVVFHRGSSDSGNHKKQLGTLELNCDGFHLRNKKEHLVMAFKCDEVTSIEFQTMWEILIHCEPKGKSSVTYTVICPKLGEIMYLMKPLFGRKIKPSASSTSLNGFMPRSVSCMAALSNKASSPTGSIEEAPSLEDGFLLSRDDTMQMTDEEIEQLHRLLGNMRSLASEITKEHDSQLEKIDRLINDVGETDSRMKSDIRKMKKLM